MGAAGHVLSPRRVGELHRCDVEGGLQHEYNKAIAECDIFVLLFFTKVGRYTAEEFETAFGAFRTGNKPLIYTYFKDNLVLTGDIDESVVSLLDFKKKLGELKHYYTRYRSAEELKWLFSRQLDKLYGDTQGLSLEITEATPQSQIDNIALALVNRFFSEVDAHTTVDTGKLSEAVRRSSEMARHTIFLLANKLRKNNWAADKPMMERAIPILQALVTVDPHKHYYFVQLAFALKDSRKPAWQAAKEFFDRAIELLGDNEAGSWPWYEFNRAVCLIKLDTDFTNGRPSDATSRKAILQDLRAAERELGELGEILEQPWNMDVRRWLELNRVGRLTSP